MLVKPATPLTAILLIAFTLLLLSVLSTPIVKSIPLATYKDISFGVFGFCKGSQCSSFQVGYDFDAQIKDAPKESEFDLPADIRASLSSLLIVHPVAAFLTLVCLALAGAAHLHSPSHSPRYLLGLLILLLPTLLVSLLAFLVDILLFVPHLQWGGWIVLGATILLTASGVMTCAMRRTLVSRKARKRRIAENAEMSGENFYNRQNASNKLGPTATNTTAASHDAPATSAPTADSLPTFATFESRTRSPDNDQRPLNSQSPPPGFVPETSGPYASSSDRGDPFGAAAGPPGGRNYGGPGNGNGGGPPRGVPYGLPPNARDPMDPRLREQTSNSSMGSHRGGSFRGRGGFPPRGGRGGPYGGGPRGPPPPNGYRGRGPPRGSMRGRGRPPPPVGYNPDDGYGGYGNRGPPPPGDPYGPPRRPSPGMRGPSPVGGGAQDIEMDVAPGTSRPMDGPLAREASPGPGFGNVQSPTSVYSQEPYVPARSGWNNEPTLPNISPGPTPPAQPRSPLGGRSGSAQGYVEDVDPRFAQSTTPGTSQPPRNVF